MDDKFIYVDIGPKTADYIEAWVDKVDNQPGTDQGASGVFQKTTLTDSYFNYQPLNVYAIDTSHASFPQFQSLALSLFAENRAKFNQNPDSVEDDASFFNALNRVENPDSFSMNIAFDSVNVSLLRAVFTDAVLKASSSTWQFLYFDKSADNWASQVDQLSNFHRIVSEACPQGNQQIVEKYGTDLLNLYSFAAAHIPQSAEEPLQASPVTPSEPAVPGQPATGVPVSAAPVPKASPRPSQPAPASGGAPVPQPASTPAPTAPAPAPQKPVLELQTTRTAGTKSFSGTVSISDVPLDQRPTIDNFKEVIFTAAGYPLTAEFMRTKVLTKCELLGWSGSYAIVYQQTGGGMGVAPRHYVIALQVKSKTADKIVIGWDLVNHRQNAAGAFEGPYASTLNAARSTHTYTPYNHGSWVYDRAAGTITYSLDNDSGGKLPGFLVNKGAIMAFPQELLKEKWGIKGKLE